jgi:muramoyltetrapeptide carboxypeptidase
MRILPFVDFGRISRHPKIFVGFSDLTALLAALGTCAGIVAFHGPTLTCLADSSPETRHSFAQALRSGAPEEIRLPSAVVIRGGKGAGPLVGGNLSILCHLLGTPFSPEYRGAILLLEDRGEKTYRIDRMLAHLKLAGCFDHLAGLIIGDFADCGDTDALFRMVADAVGDRRIPIMAGLDVGHGETNLTLPLGCPAILETDPGRLRFPAGGRGE